MIHVSIDACEAWFRITRNAETLKFLASCLDHTLVHFYPSILQHPSVPAAIADDLEATLEPLTRGTPLNSGIHYRFRVHFTLISKVLKMETASTGLDDKTSFFHDNAHRTYASYLLIIPHMDTPEFRASLAGSQQGDLGLTDRQARKYIAGVRRQARRLFAVILESKGIVLDAELAREEEEMWDQPHAMAHFFLKSIYGYFVNNVVCFHLNCPIAWKHQLARKAYPKCSGCKIVTYCSAKCQKAAWKSDPFPHRNV